MVEAGCWAGAARPRLRDTAGLRYSGHRVAIAGYGTSQIFIILPGEALVGTFNKEKALSPVNTVLQTAMYIQYVYSRW